MLETLGNDHAFLEMKPKNGRVLANATGKREPNSKNGLTFTLRGRVMMTTYFGTQVTECLYKIFF